MEIYQKIEDLRKELNQLRPLSYESLMEMKGFFNIDFIYNSNAIEGNTLTLSETKVVIEDGLTIHGKSLNEHMEALGGNDAFNKMFKFVKGDLFSEEELLEIHKAFYVRINPEEAGVYRTSQVFFLWI
jgi:Fic family protein